MVPQIKSAVRRDETLLRLGGDCYSAGITWTADDRQLLAMIDGAGWPAVPHDHNGYYSSRLFSIDGAPQSAAFRNLASYPDILLYRLVRGSAPYYGMNVLAVDGCIYQFLSTENHNNSQLSAYRLETCESMFSDINFISAKLIYSPDNGRTWCNQDGSTPVTLEPKEDQSRKNMMFFHEPQGAFTYPSFLQMGKGYQDNQDGYVYIYSPNGLTEGTMNELVLCRMPKTQILNRGALEYFAGFRADGGAEWAKDIDARAVVHTFPRGWVPSPWPIAWLPSIVYNAPLGVYLMANCSGVRGVDCLPPPNPSYLGFWVAHTPWGPWRQIHEETKWTPGADSKARAAAPQIAPQWIAKDGKSFWLVWTDVQMTTNEDTITPAFSARTSDDWMQARSRWRQITPYWGFNTQRVDLVVA